MLFRSLRHHFEWVDRLHLFILVLINIKLDVLAGPNPGDLHLVKSQCASLVSADVSGASHNFTGS